MLLGLVTNLLKQHLILTVIVLSLEDAEAKGSSWRTVWKIDRPLLPFRRRTDEGLLALSL